VSEQRARDAVEHLQAAAIEVIAAMRAFLDVAEELVRDPAQVTAAVQGLADTARAAASMVPTQPPHGADDDGVTRIRVS
jgi:hypothetical protein